MLLDSRPLTEPEAAELVHFLVRHELPPLARVPVIGRLLWKDMRAFEHGQPAHYILPEALAQPAAPRIVEMKAMRSVGQTLQQIGDRFGISRERVRQLLRGMPRPKRVVWPIKGLARAMSRALKEAGYYKCSSCKLWRSDVTYKRCPECNRRQALDYARQHPEQVRAAERRYRERLKQRKAESKLIAKG